MRSKDYEKVSWREKLLIEIVNQSRTEHSSEVEIDLEFVVFSMDRALQLHGLLKSMKHYIRGDFSVQVLYRASTDAHQKSYDEVISLLGGEGFIAWYREVSFRDDLIKILNAGSSKTLCFLVDDIVFIRPTDLGKLQWSRYSDGVLSLRLGRGINYCYTKGRAMNAPALNVMDGAADILKFEWADGEYDWVYPLSVDGHFFPRTEVMIAAEALNYTAPNSFEKALQIMTPLYSQRSGYCFEKPKLLNIPLNRVQNENNNISADVSPEYLLEKWNEGLMFDFMKFADVSTNSVHQECEVAFSKR